MLRIIMRFYVYLLSFFLDLSGCNLFFKYVNNFLNNYFLYIYGENGIWLFFVCEILI